MRPSGQVLLSCPFGILGGGTALHWASRVLNSSTLSCWVTQDSHYPRLALGFLIYKMMTVMAPVLVCWWVNLK